MRASSAARTLVSDLLYVQNQAIATSTKVYVQFDVTNSTYTVLTALPSTIATHPVNKSPFVVALNTGSLNGCGIQSVNFDDQTMLAFDELGTPYSVSGGVATALQSGKVIIKSGNYSLKVMVLPVTGQIIIQ